MKKSIVLTVAVAALIGMSLGSAAFAEEKMGMMGDKSKGGKGMMMDKKDMMGEGNMGGGMMGGMMMKGMMEKTVTATSDGGVVVLTGNQLFKYDADLKLVNKAEVPVDMAAMQKNMTGMMKMCPMMSENGGMMGSGDSPADTSAGSTKAIDHEAHH